VDKSRVGICLDTCHLFAAGTFVSRLIAASRRALSSAGYDIRTKEGYEKTMAEFDRIVGFSYLKGMHLNGNFVASAVPSLPHTHHPKEKNSLCKRNSSVWCILSRLQTASRSWGATRTGTRILGRGRSDWNASVVSYLIYCCLVAAHCHLSSFFLLPYICIRPWSCVAELKDERSSFGSHPPHPGDSMR
jgi:hypothetical protein